MDTTTLEPSDIDEVALSLLRTVFGNEYSIKLPVDLDEIAKHCGLSIKQGEFVDKGLEGALDRQEKTIFLSKNDDFARKNFTLAHELGHFKLHEDVKTDIFTMHQLETLMSRQEDQDPKEREADLFAASLLMPKKFVESLWEATNKDVDSISKIFGVPVEVARFRLRTLGLL